MMELVIRSSPSEIANQPGPGEPDQTPRSNYGQLDALTFLRFVAASAIVLHHSVDTFQLSPAIEKLNLALAVSFFFVLSGFILAYVYPKVSNASEALRFWRARIARCWPLHLICFIWFALIIKIGFGCDENGNPNPAAAAANIFLVQAWIPDPRFYFSFNAPSWSVSAEFFFYLCFPILQFWRGRGASVLKLVIALGVAGGLAVACSLFASRIADTQLQNWLLYVSPASRLFEFILGVACASIYVRFRHLNKAAVATCIQFCALTLWVSFCFHMPFIFSWIGPSCPPQMVFGLGCALLIFALALERGIFSRLMSSKLAVKLGDISYAVYLLHSPLSHACRPFWEQLVKNYGICAFAIYMTTLLLICLLIHQFVELPLRNLLVGKRKFYS